MQKIRIAILIFGLLLMLFMGLYPPWVHRDKDGKTIPMGYSFIWQPPVQRVDTKAKVLGFNLNVELGERRANTIDITQLMMQEAIAAFIVFGGVLVAGKVAAEGAASPAKEK